MPDRDKQTLDDVHRKEADPFSDRQNLEPEPSFEDAEDEAVRLDDDVIETNSQSDVTEYSLDDPADDISEEEAPRNHDDDDPWGDGIHDTPLVKRYEDMADRDELARRVEELVADAYDWAGRAEDDDAMEIYQTLLAVAERLGNPSEDTTRTEAGEPPPDRDEADA